jgi:hypothetical protein
MGDRLVAMQVTYTQNKHTYIHALSGIRTRDPSVRADENDSCLRLHGHCDRHIIYSHCTLCVVHINVRQIPENLTMFFLLTVAQSFENVTRPRNNLNCNSAEISATQRARVAQTTLGHQRFRLDQHQIPVLNKTCHDIRFI